jgi:hypothetical protein
MLFIFLQKEMLFQHHLRNISLTLEDTLIKSVRSNHPFRMLCSLSKSSLLYNFASSTKELSWKFVWFISLIIIGFFGHSQNVPRRISPIPAKGTYSILFSHFKLVSNTKFPWDWCRIIFHSPNLNPIISSLFLSLWSQLSLCLFCEI